jgi:hypothetical protein
MANLNSMYIVMVFICLLWCEGVQRGLEMALGYMRMFTQFVPLLYGYARSCWSLHILHGREMFRGIAERMMVVMQRGNRAMRFNHVAFGERSPRFKEGLWLVR